MTQKGFLGSALGLVMLFTSCDKAAPDTREADAKALKAIEVDLVKWMQAKDAKKYASFYSADARLYSIGAPVVVGPAAIEALLKSMTEDPNFGGSFATTKVTVSKSGDLASTEGSYEFTGSDPATKQKVTDKGNYVTGWKKQEDGGWKIYNDIMTSEMPPSAAASAPAHNTAKAKKKKKH